MGSAVIVIRHGVRFPHILTYAMTAQSQHIDKIILLLPQASCKEVQEYLLLYPEIKDKVKVRPVRFWDLFGNTSRSPRPFILGCAHIKTVDDVVCTLLKEGFHRDDIVFNMSETFMLTSRMIAKRFVERGIGRLTITAFETIPNRQFVKAELYRRLSSPVLESVHVAVASTLRASDMLALIGIDKENVVIIPPGVDTELFRPVKRDSECIRFLYAGRLVAEKGVSKLISIWKKVIQRIDCELTLVGSLRTRIDEILLALLLTGKGPISIPILPNLSFWGPKPYTNMPDIYGKADVFIYLSTPRNALGLVTSEEQFGFSVVEAMSVGCAIVASNSGGLPEVVPSPPNIIVGLRDSVEVIADRIYALIESSESLTRAKKDNRKLCKEHYDARKQGLQIAKTLLS